MPRLLLELVFRRQRGRFSFGDVRLLAWRTDEVSRHYGIALATLIPCAFLLLFVAQFVFSLSPFPSMLFGVSPLIWYHLGYLAPRARKGLSQAAIDSVYYFGFLLTLGALAVSAILLAKQGTPKLEAIGSQFGVGLLATGYAIVARIHLTSVAANVAEANPDVAMSNVVKQSRELVTQIELAAGHFNQFAENLIRESNQSVRVANEIAQESIRTSSKLFEESIKEATTRALEGLEEIRAIVHDSTFSTERRALSRSVAGAVKQMNALEENMQRLASCFAKNVNAFEVIAPVADETLSRFQSLNQELTVLNSPETGLAGVGKSINQAAELIENAAHLLESSLPLLSELSEALGGVGPSLKSLKTVTKKATEQIEALAAASQSFEGTARSVEGLADAGDRFAQSFNNAVGSADVFDRKLSEFSGGIESTSSALLTVLKMLEDLTQQLGNVNELSKSLSSQSIADGVTNVRSAQEAIQKLEGSLRDFQAGVETANATIRTAVSGAASALENDLKRSTGTVNLLSSRLVEVAQEIINGVKNHSGGA